MFSTVTRQEEIGKVEKHPWTTALAVGAGCEDLVKRIQ